MSPLEDSTPEEMKPENEQMIAFLRTLSRKPSTVSAEDQTQAMERIQQRLARASINSQYEESVQGSGLWKGSNQPPKQKQIRSLHPLMDRLSLIAAVLVVAVIVGSTVLVLNLARQQRTTGQRNMQQENGLPSRVYVSGSGIACLDGKTGTVLWHYNESARQPSGIPSRTSFWTPVVTSERVYAVADTNEQGGDVYAFNAHDGTPLWRRALDTNHGVNQPLLVDGILYVNAVNSTNPNVKDHQVYVYALNPLDGSIKKRYSVVTTPAGYVEDMIHSAIANGMLYITTSNTIYAFDLSTGKQIWHQLEHPVQKFFSVQVLQGIVYTSSFEMAIEGQPQEGGGHVYAYNARNGQQIWKSASIATASDAYLEVAGQSVYVTTYKGLLALNRLTGNERWSYSTAPSGDLLDIIDRKIPPLVDGNMVYITEISTKRGAQTSDISIVALNVTDGSNGWKQPVHLHVIQAVDGVIYAADQQGYIVALRASNHSQLWKVQIGKPQGQLSTAYSNEAIIVP